MSATHVQNCTFALHVYRAHSFGHEYLQDHLHYCAEICCGDPIEGALGEGG